MFRDHTFETAPTPGGPLLQPRHQLRRELRAPVSPLLSPLSLTIALIMSGLTDLFSRSVFVLQMSVFMVPINSPETVTLLGRVGCHTVALPAAPRCAGSSQLPAASCCLQTEVVSDAILGIALVDLVLDLLRRV